MNFFMEGVAQFYELVFGKITLIVVILRIVINLIAF